ncbi:hypothetical protein B296_00030673 [Ensete ventricosum]|uniref:Uncharacterized protein n=1 Tax=Ensete ventricosum TaxID=4639 RepID=A0A426XD97_ENSVE|nr:hypothetical protein B296_00030673 [Ensete ventricosum]
MEAAIPWPVRRLGESELLGNSPGVRRELAKGIGSLPGWRKGVHQKKTKTRRKIVGGSRKACRDSLGDSSKGSGSSLGTHWEITGRLTVRMSKAAGLVGVLSVVDPPRTGG